MVLDARANVKQGYENDMKSKTEEESDIASQLWLTNHVQSNLTFYLIVSIKWFVG